MECDDFKWKKVLTQYSDRLLTIVLKSQLITLPTPNNWGSSKNLSCAFYVWLSQVLNVENKTTPNKVRYTWRHNNVHRVLCNVIIQKVQQCYGDNKKRIVKTSNFIEKCLCHINQLC